MVNVQRSVSFIAHQYYAVYKHYLNSESMERDKLFRLNEIISPN